MKKVREALVLIIPLLSFMWGDSRGVSTGDAGYAVSSQGVWRDVSQYVSFSSALSALGSENATLVISTSQNIVRDIIVPENIVLRFEENGRLNISANATAAINGPLIAGRHQIFAGNGGAAVIFGYGTKVNPKWWGAIENADTGSAGLINIAALEAAQNSIKYRGGVVEIDDVYYIGGKGIHGSGPLVSLKNNVTIEGTNDKAAIKTIRGQLSYSDYTMMGSTNLQKFTIRNLTLDGNAGGNIATNGQSMGCIYFADGQDIVIENVKFLNMPGRQDITGGWGKAPAKRVTVRNCLFQDHGGAYPGNQQHQNDHSCIYGLWDDARVINNTFINTAKYNPVTPAISVSAIEVHGSNFIVKGNVIENWTHGVHIYSGDYQERGIKNVTISGNTMRTIHRAGVYAENRIRHAEDVVIADNQIAIDSTYYHYPAGISLTGAAKSMFNNLLIEGNAVTDQGISSSLGSSGIYVGDASRVRILGNTLRNISNGISLYFFGPNTGENITIKNNTVSGAYTAKGIYISNQIPGCIIKDITISDNKIGPGQSGGATYGIQVVAVYPIDSLVITGDNRIEMYYYYHWISITGKNIKQYAVMPRIHHSPSASPPAKGLYVAGQDIIYTSDTTAGFTGRVVTATGGAYSAPWSRKTPYRSGDWIFMPAQGKIAECIVAGRSGPGEPKMPLHMGDTVTDGTATWRYRAKSVAAFKTFKGSK